MERNEIEKVIEEVGKDYDQSKHFRQRFMGFYQNTVNNNLGSSDLRNLIEKVSIPDEESR